MRQTGVDQVIEARRRSSTKIPVDPALVPSDDETAFGNDAGPDMHGLGGEHPERVLRETPIEMAALVAVQLGSEERAADVSFGRSAHERDG